MKSILKHWLIRLMNGFARRILLKYNPVIIGVAGSVGKTSTKDAVAKVLSSKLPLVGKTFGSLNTEFSAPLNILAQGLNISIETFDFKSLFFKLFVIKLSVLNAIRLLLFRSSKYPKYLVLELAEDKPGDMDNLLSLLKPKVGIVTAIGDIPAHSGFYPDSSGVAKENAKLIAALPNSGVAVLNADENRVVEMGKQSKAKVLTYGFSDSDFQAESFKINIEGEEIKGITFSVKGQIFVLSRALGRHQAYSALAAIATGSYFNITLEEAASALKDFEFPKFRMQLQPGPEQSIIINDAYNASPLAVEAACKTFEDIANTIISQRGYGKKIIILGDMLELGQYSKEAHRIVGEQAGSIADLIYCIGDFREDTAAGALKHLTADKVRTFEKSAEAAPQLKLDLGKGGVVLLKGSRGVFMQKVLESIV